MVKKNQEIDYKRLWYVSIMSVVGLMFILTIFLVPISPDSIIGSWTRDGNVAGQAIRLSDMRVGVADGGIPPNDRLVITQDGKLMQVQLEQQYDYERTTDDGRASADGVGTGFGSGQVASGGDDGDGPKAEMEIGTITIGYTNKDGEIEFVEVESGGDLVDDYWVDSGSGDRGPVSGFINPETGEFVVVSGGSSGSTTEDKLTQAANLGREIGVEDSSISQMQMIILLSDLGLINPDVMVIVR